MEPVAPSASVDGALLPLSAADGEKLDNTTVVLTTQDMHRGAPIDDIMADYIAWGETQGGFIGGSWSAAHAAEKRAKLGYWKENLGLEFVGDLRGKLSVAEACLRELKAGYTNKTLNGHRRSQITFHLVRRARLPGRQSLQETAPPGWPAAGRAPRPHDREGCAASGCRSTRPAYPVRNCPPEWSARQRNPPAYLEPPQPKKRRHLAGGRVDQRAGGTACSHYPVGFWIACTTMAVRTSPRRFTRSTTASASTCPQSLSSSCPNIPLAV